MVNGSMYLEKLVAKKSMSAAGPNVQNVEKVKRREFVILANKYKDDKHRAKVNGWLVSEKLDGTRCFWDGGVSRGKLTIDVPWASIYNPKDDGQLKKKIKPVASGLWSRYGNPIMAPDWFLDGLPIQFLDGELWAGHGQFQLNRSICAGDTPDPRFDQIRYMVYGAPTLKGIFQDGEIKNANFHRQIDFEACAAYVRKAGPKLMRTIDNGRTTEATFADELQWLGCLGNHCAGTKPTWEIHKQVTITPDMDLVQYMEQFVEAGAEGVVIRNPAGIYTPKRVNDLLKYKPWEDDEGTLKGFTSGRETDKGSKHLGKIGALILDYKGQRLELAGLTDEERLFTSDAMFAHAAANPGKDMPDWFRAKHFKLGDQITFQYRELSDDKIPKEARYYRVRDEE